MPNISFFALNDEFLALKVCGRVQINLHSAPFGAFEFKTWELHISRAKKNYTKPLHKLSSSKLRSSLIFQMQCFFALAPPWASKLKAWNIQEGPTQMFLCLASTFGIESWRPKKKKKLLQPLLQFSSLELESFKRGQSKLSCLGRAPKNPKKLHNFWTL